MGLSYFTSFLLAPNRTNIRQVPMAFRSCLYRHHYMLHGLGGTGSASRQRAELVAILWSHIVIAEMPLCAA